MSAPTQTISCSAVLVVAYSAALLAACSGNEAGSGTLVADSAGVTLVTGPGQDKLLAWTVEEVLRIPPLNDEGEGFFNVTELDVLAGDRIAVLDSDGKRVVL